MKAPIAALALLAAGGAFAAPLDRHVVIVTVDGLCPDAIAAAPAPHIAALAAAGLSTQAARAVEPTHTLPSHVSMATGLPPSVHGITTNKELRRELGLPTVFTAVHDAGGRTALYYGKAKLAVLAPGRSADVVYGPAPGEKRWHDGASAVLAAHFAGDFARERFALAWIHLREPDLAGHKAGWMSADYLAAVREADVAVEVIMDAIRATGLPATLILTSDHGGEGTRHSSGHVRDAIVPWMCVRPGLARGALGNGVRTLDVAPTALALLGLAPLPRSEGRVVTECLHP